MAPMQGASNHQGRKALEHHRGRHSLEGPIGSSDIKCSVIESSHSELSLPTGGVKNKSNVQISASESKLDSKLNSNVPAVKKGKDFDLNNEEDEGDSFFDDPLPKPEKTYGWITGKNSDTDEETEDPFVENGNRHSPEERRTDSSRPAGSLASLSDAPPLKTGLGSLAGVPPLKGPTDRVEDDYDDDDFNSTSHRSDKTKSEVSIGEEIEEELSIEGVDFNASDKHYFHSLVCVCFSFLLLPSSAPFYIALSAQGSLKGGTWVGSISYGLIMIFGPVSGKMTEKFGARIVSILGSILIIVSIVGSSYASKLDFLFLTHGVLTGIGSSFAFTPGMIMISQYFTTQRSLATGIVMSGGAAGALVQTRLHQYLIRTVGWRQSMRIFAGIMGISVMAGFAYKPLNPPGHSRSVVENLNTSPIKGFIVDLGLWKDRVFLIWVFANGLAKFGFFIPYVHLINHGVQLGIPFELATNIMLVLGMSSFISRIIFGRICNSSRINRLYINQGSVFTVGWMNDMYGSYNLGFIVAGALNVASVFVLALIPWAKRSSMQNRKSILSVSMNETTHEINPWIDNNTTEVIIFSHYQCCYCDKV
ncbi:UNVERIFIED_CONTAM: hypothetical protein FKN15_030220 [Acipenser sinensis]